MRGSRVSLKIRSGAEKSILASASAPSLAVVTLYPDFFRLTSKTRTLRGSASTKRSCFFATRFHLPVVPRVRDTGSVEGFHPAVKLSSGGRAAPPPPLSLSGPRGRQSPLPQ